MNKAVHLVLVLLCVGCAHTARSRPSEVNAVDRARLVQIAKQEVERRKLALRRPYDVEVEPGIIGNEIGPPRQIYIVRFIFKHRAKKDVIYTVFINRRDQRIDQFFDSREMVPSRVNDQ